MELGNEKFAKQLYYSLFADRLAGANQLNNQTNTFNLIFVPGNLTSSAQDAKKIAAQQQRKETSGLMENSIKLEMESGGPIERGRCTAQWNGVGLTKVPGGLTLAHNVTTHLTSASPNIVRNVMA